MSANNFNNFNNLNINDNYDNYDNFKCTQNIKNELWDDVICKYFENDQSIKAKQRIVDVYKHFNIGYHRANIMYKESINLWKEAILDGNRVDIPIIWLLKQEYMINELKNIGHDFKMSYKRYMEYMYHNYPTNFGKLLRNAIAS